MLKSGEILTAKLRSSQPDQEIRIIGINDGILEAEFAEPQKAITPGQSLVLYRKDIVVAVIAVVIVMLFFRVAPTWHLIWMIPALLLLMVFCMGISLLIGALAVFFRDMIHLWSVLLTAWTYLTPIFWDLSLLTGSNAPWYVIAVVKANPMYNYIDMMRCAIVYQASPGTTVILLAIFWAVVALVAGLLVFRKTEHKFILYI